ncbi:MAG: MobF family relaxase [Solirubrobacterales bacterium]
MTKIGSRTKDYWINAVAEGGEDYYSKPGEAPGYWAGSLAAELGLTGEVDPDAYALILAGEDPGGGGPLVRRAAPRVFVDASGKERRLEPILGYDVRFSAPKSVSLLWALGSPLVRATVLAAHAEAVAAALAYLEREACFVQRGKGGSRIERGTGFVSMAFLHRSSRAGDPTLHTHVVTANMTRAVSDGRWLSLANPRSHSPLLREAKTAGHLYQAALRAALTRELGVAWNEVTNGYADLELFDRELIEHFSRRRAQILRELERLGFDSAAAAEVAAYRTRGPKDHRHASEAQREEWRSRAAEFGVGEASIDAELGRLRGREPRGVEAADLDAAIATLEEHHSHFDRRDLLCALVNRMREGAGAEELSRAVDAALDSDRVVCIHRGEGLLATTYWTTPRLWELERRVLRSAREGEAAGAAVVEEATLTAVLARHPYLSEEQVAMVRRLTTGGERILTVAALPGAGKTTALRAAAEAWAEAGIPGLGVAGARSASGELGDGAGIPATSIADLLIRCERRTERGLAPLPTGAVVLMDESSTTSTPQMAAVLELAERCQGKLVAIGDPRQIGAVGPGGLYGHLTGVTRPSVLTEIRRQRDPIDRHIVELAHEGRGSDALDLLRAEGRLVIAEEMEDTLDALALDWHHAFTAGEDAVMVARRGRDVADLNARARALLRAEGKLDGPAVDVGGAAFARGDHLVTRANGPKVSNRERWEVLDVDPDERRLLLRRLEGDRRELVIGRRYLERRTDSGGPSVEHAYALTTYATESKTFESAFALLDSGISREDFLVAVSRARGETRAYGVAAGELLDADLGPATREVSDEAHDLRLGSERVAGEYAAVEVAARRAVESLSPPQLAARRGELIRALGQRPPGAAAERLATVERRIATERERLDALSGSRVAGSAGADAELARTSEEMGRQALGRLEAERQELARRARAEARRKAGPRGPERTELVLIEDRLVELRRRAVAADRVRPSAMILAALGPRPEDPHRVAEWNDAVDLIHGYRLRHGIHPEDALSLGRPARDPQARREHREAKVRLARLQHALGREQERQSGREIGIGR